MHHHESSSSSGGSVSGYSSPQIEVILNEKTEQSEEFPNDSYIKEISPKQKRKKSDYNLVKNKLALDKMQHTANDCSLVEAGIIDSENDEIEEFIPQDNGRVREVVTKERF